MRIGVYADLLYKRDEQGTLSTDRAFILFVTALAPQLDELVLFGRLDPRPGSSPYALPRERVRLVPLPHYPRVTNVLGVLRSLGGARRSFARELADLDAVWIFGPYPVSMVFVLQALKARKRVVLGVRQDFPEYVRNRLPSRAWAWAVGVAYAFEGIWRLLARRLPSVVVGEELGRKYGPRALATGFSLVRDDDVVRIDDAVARSWDGDELRLLTVGRIDKEKNPLLLPEVLALLRERDPRWRLSVVGTGPLEPRLRERARELGVEDALELRGYVTHGAELWSLYRGAHAFLHVSLTEGLPQVLFEAAASGTPIVATDVGGVADAKLGLLVPPRDARAAVDAVDSLRTDPALRERLVRDGLAKVETTEAQLARIAPLFRS